MDYGAPQIARDVRYTAIEPVSSSGATLFATLESCLAERQSRRRVFAVREPVEAPAYDRKHWQLRKSLVQEV
jgi:hypothetical protein